MSGLSRGQSRCDALDTAFRPVPVEKDAMALSGRLILLMIKAPSAVSTACRAWYQSRLRIEARMNIYLASFKRIYF